MSAEITQWIAELRSSEASVRADAARELCYAAEEAQPAAVELALATGDDDEEVREWAVGALEELGPPAEDAVGRLTELLTHSENDVAYWGATLLGRLGDAASAAVAALTSTLTDHAEIAVRQRAAWALGEIGPSAANAKPVLESIVQNADNERLVSLASAAIAAIDS